MKKLAMVVVGLAVACGGSAAYGYSGDDWVSPQRGGAGYYASRAAMQLVRSPAARKEAGDLAKGAAHGAGKVVKLVGGGLLALGAGLCGLGKKAA